MSHYFYTASLLLLPLAQYPSCDVLVDAGFLCNTSVMLEKTKDPVLHQY
jgi:hypothetical protein